MELHLTNLVPDQLIKALCNTLIHSLWQGLVLAAVAGLTIVSTKKASAALRYNLMISLLILFGATIAFTFFMQLNKAESSGLTSISIHPNTAVSQAAQVNLIAVEKPGSILSNCINYFNMHSDMVVLIWFLIICARCMQLAVGLHHIYYIKRTKVLSPGKLWEDKLNELAESLGIKRTVRLMQSGIAKLPMVLGHFKPMILIPVGLLTALSAEEVESILVHELAHIRRRDYLVNLLQNLMEIVFFFNPAVLWVSSLIKAERENCCDDIVVAQTSSKVSYIKALVSCQEYQSAMPAYAMGLGGSSDHFLQRVKRMLSNNNQTLNKVEKMVLTICLISAVLLTAAFSKAGDNHHSSKSKLINRLAQIKAAVKTTDNPIKATSTTKNTETTDTVKIIKDAKPGELQLNGGKGEIVDDVDNLVSRLADEKAREQWKLSNTRAAQLLAMLDTLKNKGKNGELTALDTLKAMEAYKAARADNSRITYYYNSKKPTGKAYGKGHKSYSYQSKSYSDDAIPAIPPVPAIPSVPTIPETPAVAPIPEIPAVPSIPPVPAIPPVPSGNTEIANELIREHLIKDKYNFTFKINNDELYIDGVKQSDEVHQRIMKKFIKPGDTIDMTYSCHKDKTVTIN